MSTGGRMVTPMSMLIDVFVEMEKLKKNLEGLRDGLVEKPEVMHVEIYDALRNCRVIEDELRSIKSLQGGISRKKDREFWEPDPEPEPPKGPPDLKLVS